MDADALDLVDTNDLVDALGRRTLGVVVITEESLKVGSGQTKYHVHHRKGWARGLGLVRYADWWFLNEWEYRKETEEDDGG